MKAERKTENPGGYWGEKVVVDFDKLPPENRRRALDILCRAAQRKKEAESNVHTG